MFWTKHWLPSTRVLRQSQVGLIVTLLLTFSSCQVYPNPLQNTWTVRYFCISDQDYYMSFSLGFKTRDYQNLKISTILTVIVMLAELPSHSFWLVDWLWLDFRWRVRSKRAFSGRIFVLHGLAAHLLGVGQNGTSKHPRKAKRPAQGAR